MGGNDSFHVVGLSDIADLSKGDWPASRDWVMIVDLHVRDFRICLFSTSVPE